MLTRGPSLKLLGGCVLAIAVGQGVAAEAPAGSPAQLDDSERSKPDAGPCLTSRAEARYSGLGYDHLVHIDNGCKEDMHCSVTTSANPAGVSVDVPKESKRSVVTFRGSPAREFTHDLQCAPK